MKDNKNVFVKQLSKEKINLILAVLSRRTIDSSHSVRFKNKFYKLVNSKHTQIFFAKGTKCMVIEAIIQKQLTKMDFENEIVQD